MFADLPSRYKTELKAILDQLMSALDIAESETYEMFMIDGETRAVTNSI